MRCGGGGGAPVDLFTETTTIIFLGIISVSAIGFFCWLVFTLAVFALPFFAGVTVGLWAYYAGAGWLGSIVVGIVAAASTLVIGQTLFAVVRSVWLRAAIALVFAVPAAVAGYHVTHGIVKLTMPSETWQAIFSVVGAIAVGIAALLRMAGMATPGPTGQVIAQG